MATKMVETKAAMKNTRNVKNLEVAPSISKGYFLC